MSKKTLVLWVLAVLAGCAMAPADAPPPRLAASALPALPIPLANNAVAALRRNDGVHLFSFLGLAAGKTWRDTRADAFYLAPGASAWTTLPPVPGPGRLAGTAAVAAESVYVFGGYTVAEDGSEESIETVHRFDPASGQFAEIPPMPVPVDDVVSVVYLDRYIYLISGWHDSGNVNLVQVLDTRTHEYFQATPYPGVPVFGHSGGIAGQNIVVCDGVKIVSTEADRNFAMEAACFIGTIRPDDPARIDWSTLPSHPGPALYRMAATGAGNRVIFAGGSPNAYNYDGIGYDGRPSPASGTIFALNVADRTWAELGKLDDPTMDHRGLLPVGRDEFAIVGGMRDPQTVSDQVIVFSTAGR